MNLIAQILIEIYSIIALLPDKWLQRLGKVAMIVYYLPALGVARRVNKNLKVIFPDKELSQNRVIAKKCIAALGRYMVEFIREFYGKGRVKIIVENPDVLLQTPAPKVCLSGHFLGFDATTQLPQILPLRMLSLYESTNSNRVLERRICEYRQKGGAICVPSNRAYPSILNHLATDDSRPLVVGALADLDPQISSSFSYVRLFNRPTPVLNGIIKIGIRIKAEIFYCSIRPIGSCCYSLRLITLPVSDSTSLDDITQAYATALESNIRDCPEAWLPMSFRKL